jgi:hypothetical protein
MTDIIHKIIYINDIFIYLLKFLNFDDKISFSKLIGKNLIKNFDIFDKKYKNKDLSEYLYICTECFDNISNDIYHTLRFKYNNFLENDQYNLCNNIHINSYIIPEQINFIYSNCYYVSVRAFLEIIDNENIVIDNNSYECVFHYELSDNIYELIYDKIQNIYESAITNNLLEVFCEKCGSFGHCSLSNKCILYSDIYKKKELKHFTKEIINDIIYDVIKIIKKTEITKKKKKKLCKSCKIMFYNKNCLNKSCRNCCDCNNHYKYI